MVASARSSLVALVIGLSANAVHAQTAAAVPAADRPQFIRVVAKDYIYEAPITVQAGIATIHLLNQGADIHHVTVQALPAGRTVRQFFDAIQNTGRPPAWSTSLGQTTAIPNGSEALIAFRMPPGQYVLTCLLPASDGRSHVVKGMFQLITATAGPVPARPTATPPATATRPSTSPPASSAPRRP